METTASPTRCPKKCRELALLTTLVVYMVPIVIGIWLTCNSNQLMVVHLAGIFVCILFPFFLLSFFSLQTRHSHSQSQVKCAGPVTGPHCAAGNLKTCLATCEKGQNAPGVSAR